MKQKTAMQQPIDTIKAESKTLDLDNPSQYSYYCALQFCLGILIDALSTERQQIIDAYYAGTAQFANHAQIERPQGPVKYFNETFEQ